MGKKSIILGIIVAAVLVLGIAVAVFFLYGGKSLFDNSKDERFAVPALSYSDLFSAVPTDAVAVISLADRTKAAELIPPGIALPEQTNRNIVFSLHNNASLVPLFISRADTGGLLLNSPSQTLIGSSQRHIEEGNSIMDNKFFVEVLKGVSDRNSVFFSNEYASKIMNAYFGKDYSKYAPLVHNISQWMGFTIKENSPTRFSLQGTAACGKGAGYYYNVLRGQGESETKIIEALPSNASFAIAIQISDLKKYGDAYQKYLDSFHQLDSFDKSSLDWAQEIGLKEVGYARWTTIGGEDAEALFVRSSRTPRHLDSAQVYNNAGRVTALFGSLFSIVDESCSAYFGDWTISGSRDAVDDILEAYRQGDKYSYESPAVFITYSKGQFNYEKVMSRGLQARRKSSHSVSAAVEIPKGPFKVRNCLTGKTNEFYQNENGYLCLNDENGKGLWGVTFSEPVCGRVQNVDYFNNGKIQFLFAAGSKLYLIDRLGRFVSGFPVDLGKRVLLGPDVYEFNGAKAYSALVLHTDNTIDIYDLKGKKAEGWKGISSEDTILDLPELVKQDGKSYWVVNTARETLVFDIDGGEPLKGKEIKSLNY